MKLCPWCKTNLSYARLGGKRGVIKWHGIPLIRNNTLVCPYCNEPVHLHANQWLYLPQLPLLYYFYAVMAKRYDLLFPPTAIDWLLVTIGIFSIVVQQITTRYEKNK
jgi:hypothetical protein